MTAFWQPVSDSALIEKMIAGDEAALSTMYDRYAPMLFGVLMRILRDEQAAEDGDQQTDESEMGLHG